MAEYEVKFLAGYFRQFKSPLDLISQITLSNGKPQVEGLDLWRVVIDDK